MTRRTDAAVAASLPAVARAPADPTLGEIVGDRVYTLRAFCRRLGWREHALRQARAAGLRLVVFGREKLVLGSDFLAFVQGLADRQTAAARDTGASNREGTP
jgi:hypothetical protein